MKRTYSSMWTGEDLDEDYGNSTQGPPKDRRAGAVFCTIMSCQQPCGSVNSWTIHSPSSLCVTMPTKVS